MQIAFLFILYYREAFEWILSVATSSPTAPSSTCILYDVPANISTNRAVLTLIDICVSLYEREEEAIMQFRVSSESQRYVTSRFCLTIIRAAKAEHINELQFGGTDVDMLYVGLFGFWAFHRLH